MGQPTYTPFQETFHNGGFIVSLANGHQSIDQGTLTGGVKVLAGTVLGTVTSALTAAAAALGANTGNGTFGTITPQAAPATMIGVYNILFTAATAFTVTAPDGDRMALNSPEIVPVLAVTFTVPARIAMPPGTEARICPALETFAVIALIADALLLNTEILPPLLFVTVAVLAATAIAPAEIVPEFEDTTTVTAAIALLPFASPWIAPALATVAVPWLRMAVPFALFAMIVPPTLLVISAAV